MFNSRIDGYPFNPKPHLHEKRPIIKAHQKACRASGSFWNEIQTREKEKEIASLAGYGL